jgi:hypothetical protein
LHGDRHRHDLVLVLAGRLEGGRALLRHQGVLVLRLARHLVAFGDDLRGQPHRHVDLLVVIHEPGVEQVHLVEVVLQHGDRLEAAADHRVGALVLHHVRGDRDGVEARGAEAAHGRARDLVRQAAHDGDVAADVEALRPLGEAGSHDDVVDLLAIELRHLLEQGLDAVSGHVVRPGLVERAAEGLGETGPCRGDDDCFTHLAHGTLLWGVLGNFMGLACHPEAKQPRRRGGRAPAPMSG